MNTANTLDVCEYFYSIQGEGKTSGRPAIFLRLSGCNLMCKGFASGCDTYPLWLENTKTEITALLNHWQQHGWLEKLEQGVHLVITGGEPLLQQTALINFIAALDTKISKLYIELETNATIYLEQNLAARINQINASPKLTNSGNTREQAYNPKVIAQLAALSKTVFKFVISQEQDINEITQQYMLPFNIAPNKIWLMPEGNTALSINKKTPMIVELCKEHLMNFSPRLQITCRKVR